MTLKIRLKSSPCGFFEGKDKNKKERKREGEPSKLGLKKSKLNILVLRYQI